MLKLNPAVETSLHMDENQNTVTRLEKGAGGQNRARSGWRRDAQRHLYTEQGQVRLEEGCSEALVCMTGVSFGRTNFALQCQL